jgi:hypothetical protein
VDNSSHLINKFSKESVTSAESNVIEQENTVVDPKSTVFDESIHVGQQEEPQLLVSHGKISEQLQSEN